MPSSRVINTPKIIQQAWNDGLYNLREKRNNVARGASIEEKAMYVLGLGWKFRGNTEVKDNEVENTLYVSLQGLTQESKFLKIGQVLWEQCDEAFILKMISSLSNNTPSQSRMYQQISLSEKQNFKGYFSKANVKSINKNNLSGHDILNRESRQLGPNAKMNEKYKEDTLNKRKELESSKINSKKFDRKMIRFKPGSKEIRVLANELEIVLKTYESANLVPIAMSLGIPVESGFNKSYLIESIKSYIGTYVENELLITRAGNLKNVYIRQTPEGLSTIKRLLRYTSFAHLTFGGDVTIQELNEMAAEVEKVRDKASSYKGFLGKFKPSKLNKEVSKKDKFLNKVLDKEKKPSSKMKSKFKKSMAKPLYEFFKKNGLGNVSFLDRSYNVTIEDVAIEKWIDSYGTEVELAKSIITNEFSDNKDVLTRLKFIDFSNDQLLEHLLMIANSLGIEKESYPNLQKDGLLPNSPAFFMVAVMRRFFAMQTEGSRFGLYFGKKGRKKQLDTIMAKFQSNLNEESKEKAKNDKFAIGADGSHSPLAIGVERLKIFWNDMQPVYVVGGSVYAFSRGGSVSPIGGGETSEARKKINAQVVLNRRLAGAGGKLEAFEMSSRGENMGAYGTQEAPLIQGAEESNEMYFRRVIEAKMINEFKGKGLTVNESIQPVFLVNKGINTSNIEVTALLNLIPSILNVIPGIGTAAGMAFSALMQSQIDAAKNLPKFARGGSFSTRNTNVSQFISGDSINNKINPERVTIDWATQRVNVQPLNNTTNNVTNVESGRITDPIMGTSTTVKVNDKSGRPSQAINVVNAINPFDEALDSGGINATPMQVLVSLKESLVDILSTLNITGQVGQANTQMTAKVVDAINALNDTMSKNSNSGSGNIFGNIGKLARGE